MNDMPKRTVKMTVRLSADEEKIRKRLETHLGVDGNGVMRQGMLDLARREGISLPETEKAPNPKGPGARKR